MITPFRTTALAILTLGAWIMLAVGALGQTTTATLSWDQAYQPGGFALTDVQAFGYEWKVDAGTAVVLTQTCVDVTDHAHCTAPIATLSSGPHTVTLTVIGPSGQASVTINTAAPNAPVRVTMTIKITVP